MRTGKWILMALLAFAAGCVAEAPEIGTAQQELGLPHGFFDDEMVDDEDVDELPPCSEVHISGDVLIHPVAGSGGLFAVEQDGELICVDDSDGLRQAGIGESPLDLGEEDQVEVPLHAKDPPPTDGTPLPATGGTLVSDGTPLPANPNK